MATEQFTRTALCSVETLEARKSALYAKSGNPLVESGLVDTLCNLKGFAAFLGDYYANGEDGHPCKDIQHGRAMAARILAEALDTVHDIEDDVRR